jgi:trehalose 6-phosphate synthase/phosphatase
LAWHYRNADPGLSQQCARELMEELRELVSRPDAPRPSGPGAGLQVLEGHKVIEVKTAGYDKGTVAVKLLASAPYDFILAVGDDRTDEDLFHALPAEAVTIKVGVTASLAKYNLKDRQGVVRLMDRLLASSAARS